MSYIQVYVSSWETIGGFSKLPRSSKCYVVVEPGSLIVPTSLATFSTIVTRKSDPHANE